MGKTKGSKPPAVPPTPRQSSGYTVLARRYRPRQLGELIGQEHVARALTNALASGRVAHAYLFTGARGTGKTSCARILAKCLNCVHGPTPTPCDQCNICARIASGDDVDVLEIDGASNNKVDEVRELRQNVGFRPARARFKIYIIDEVHMLSTGAFNALLKTLEEPPAHVKFILATTEIQKIPVTIRSRCQRFDFAFVKPAAIVEHLRRIVAQEGLEAEDAALQLVARRAGGSMRDAQSMLDQLLAFAEGRLTAAQVHEVLGTAGDERVAELAGLILRRQPATALEKLQQFSDSGVQLGEFIDQLIEHWRGLMLILAAGSGVADLPGSEQYQETLKAQAAGTNLDTVMAGLDVLMATKARSRGSLHVGTLLELAVVRLAKMDELISVTELLENKALFTEAPVPSNETSAFADLSKKNSGTSSVEPISAMSSSLKAGSILSANTTPTASSNEGSNTATTKVNLADEAELRRFLGERLGPLKAAALAWAKINANFEPNKLDILFTPGYDSAYESWTDERTTGQLQAAMQELTGCPWSIHIGLSGESDPVAASRANGQATWEDLLNKPLFRKLVSCLGAELVKLDEGFRPVEAAAGVRSEGVPPEIEL